MTTPRRARRAPPRTTTAASGSAEQVESRDVPKRRHSVAPSDLLAFRVRAAGIADRDFIDPRIGTREQRGDFWLEAESVGRETRHEGSRELAADRLVAGFHVREVEIREHVAV